MAFLNVNVAKSAPRGDPAFNSLINVQEQDDELYSNNIYHDSTDGPQSKLESSGPKIFIIDRNSSYSIGDIEFVCPSESTSGINSKRSALDPGISSQGLERIKARQPTIISRAKKLRTDIGDPIAKLENILQNIPVDDDEWDAIVQDPYG